MKTIKNTLRLLLNWMTRKARRLLRLCHKNHCRPSAATSTVATLNTATPEKDSSAPARKSAASSAKTDGNSYRADAIRFNEQFLSDHYELRYNTMKGITEFRPLHPESVTPPLPPRGGVRGGVSAGASPTSHPHLLPSKEDPESVTSPLPSRGGVGGGVSAGVSPSWLPLTERDLNRITVEQLKAGGQSWSYGMKLCIDSTLVPDFNPVAHYLDTCPQWDGEHDYIGELARRVPTSYAAWPELFHRWLLAMVAQVRGLSRDHGNALVPLLIGDQGTGKSTFCKIIMPEEMRDYYMDDIKMDNAEQVERVLGRMWLVNIDEYNSKTAREQAKIKRLLTERDVQVRRMRSDQYAMTRRLCSFIATTNDRQPLTDPTGSRRYLCVEVEGAIDTVTPVDHRQLFAQALWELQQGQPFHLTKDEERELERHNEQYRLVSGADLLLSECYEPAETGRDNLVTATAMLRRLCDRAKGIDRPTMRQLIEALKARHFRHGAQQGRHGWYAREVAAS